MITYLTVVADPVLDGGAGVAADIKINHKSAAKPLHTQHTSLLEGDRGRDGAVLLVLEPKARTNLQFNSGIGSYLRDGLHLFLLCVGSSSVQHFEEVGCLGPHTCVDVGLGDEKMLVRCG